MLSSRDKGHQMQPWAHDCNSPLAKICVDGAVSEGSDYVAEDRGEQNERYREVVCVVIFPELYILFAVLAPK